MALFLDSDQTVDKLVQITSGGIQVASYPEIRDTFIKLMKSIYGEDIDVSSTSADGQWINSISLVVNNILQLSHHAFTMLNPNTATGKYLDVLAHYNNITRNPATNSTATLYVCTTDESLTIDRNTKFIDRSAKEWIYDGEVTLSKQQANNPTWTPIIVKCTNLGPNIASKSELDSIPTDLSTYDNTKCGWIYSTATPLNIYIYQPYDTILGTYEESDQNLRNRRTKSLGSSSVSILQGLQSTLLNTDGIDDAWLYNSIDNSSTVLADNANPPIHTVYVCIRKNPQISLENSKIGSIIYNKLTPGVGTANIIASGKTLKNGSIQSYNIPKGGALNYPIYWKECEAYTGFKFSFTLQLYTLNNVSSYFDTSDGSHSARTNQERKISEVLINKLNNYYLDDNVSCYELAQTLQAADLRNEKVSTYFISDAGVVKGSSTSSKIFENELGYFNINNDNIKFIYSAKTEGKLFDFVTVTVEG